jgi:enediyne biosynthesis protein E4
MIAGIESVRISTRRLWGALLSALVLAAGVGCTDEGPDPLPGPSSPARANQAEAAVVPAEVRNREAPDAHIRLRPVTPATGIDFTHTDGGSGNFYVVELAASGLATFDYDNDGLVDLYFLSGTPLPGAAPDAPAPGNALYRNLGGFRFEDVTRAAGVGEAGYGLAVAAADYDNDGHQDLYVSNFGPKVLYRNSGQGTFTPVTASAGVSDGDQFGAGACFLDRDNDGDLDLFVANYLEFDFESHSPRSFFGVPGYRGPNDYAPLRHSLYDNRGDGTFENVSEASGIASRPGTGMGAIASDFDNDGDSDLILANDEWPNFCFRNDGNGKFAESGALVGLAYNGDGQVVGNMGVDCADYDHDGWLDFFFTTFQREFPILFRNQGGGSFRDETAKAADTKRCYNNVKWGCGFADFDNDGWKDIFVGIGHIQVNIEKFDKTSSYAARPMLLRNNGKGRFEDVTDASGDGLAVECVARGVALEDLDNDGRIDVAISNSRRPPVILRNESENQNHWLLVKLQGVKVNRDAVGARVTVTAGDLVQTDEVHSGRGYQSHFGTRLHFGLGSQDRIETIQVRWPGGSTEVWRNVEPDQLLTLTEGTGQVADTGRAAE